ncbi:MAG: tail protein X [Burkholderiaceae bacterium]|nr:tail protein X [Burkholderiaceae bacterium]
MATKDDKIDALEHITTEGERWDTLAWRYYGNPYAYAGIMDANPALDLTPYLPSGQLVLIPLLTEEAQQASRALADTPPWMR